MYEDYTYARISDDELALEKGVTRQLKESRDLSSKRGGTIVGEYHDNDISATKAPPRPDFERMMRDVTAPNPLGVQRRIVCVHTSRIWRNRMERAAGIDLLGKHGVIILPVNGPELHLATASGRMVAGMLGEVDTGESETKGERVTSAARERAEEGRASGFALYGWKRIYEYNSKGQIVGFHDDENLEQSAIVREIVDRLLGGESVIRITKDLNARGVPSPGAGWNRAHRARGQASDGSKWSKSSVRKIATRTANISLRVYHRGRPDEELLPAEWPKIVDPDKHDRVVAMLTDPSRSQTKPGARQYLLTWGIAECGIEGCGAWMRMAWKGGNRYGLKSQLYVCEESAHVGRNMVYVDALVTAHVLALLRRPDVVDLLCGSSGKAAEMLARAEALRARLTRAAADYADGLIESAQLRVITGKLRPQLEEAERLARQHRPTPHLELAVSAMGERAEERWATLDVNQRRAVMEAFGMRVIILPTRRGPGFDPKSVLVLSAQAAGQGSEDTRPSGR